MQRTNINLVAQAERALSEKWVYGWGAYGQLATAELIERLCKDYPAQNPRWRAYMQGAVGKTRLCDCYGLIKSFLWWTGDTTDPQYNGAEDKNTNAAYNAAKEKGSIKVMPELPGLILYKEGHVGVYCGGGRFIEMVGSGTGAAAGTISAGVITKGSKFTSWFKDVNITYPAMNGKIPAHVPTDKAIWDYLKGKNLNDYAVAGIMGNLFAESALKPDNLQNSREKVLNHTDESYTRGVDLGTYTNFVRDGSGYGLCQWTFWTRKEALLNYARACGKSIGDLVMQLDFMWQEIQGYTSVITALHSADSVRNASDTVMTGYLRPANQSDEAKSRRADYGLNYYIKFKGTNAGTVLPPFKPYDVRVDADNLRIRSGASTQANIVGYVDNGGVYRITAEADGYGANKWGRLADGRGWIALDFTTRVWCLC